MTRQSRVVLVDSRDRDVAAYPNQGRYKIRLPRRYTNVVAARLHSIILPASFYSFSAAAGNTTLRVTIDAATHDIVIADGNYSSDAIAAAVTSAIETAFGVTATLTIDEETLLATLDAGTGVVSVDPSTGLAYALGFRDESPPGETAVTGTAVANLAPTMYVLMEISELSTIDEGALGGGVVGRGCFAAIPLAGSFEYAIRESNVAPPLVEQRPAVRKLETLTITFRTHDGAVIDFRGVDHAFVLEVVEESPDAYDARPLRATAPAPKPPLPVARPPAEEPAEPAAPPPPVAKRQVPWGKVALAGGAALVGLWWWRRRERHAT